MLEVASGCGLTAEAEGEAKGEGDCDNDAGEEILDERRSDIELFEGGEDREDPDRPLGDVADEAGCVELRCASSTLDDALRGDRDERCNKKDQHRDDDLRQVAED